MKTITIDICYGKYIFSQHLNAIPASCTPSQKAVAELFCRILNASLIHTPVSTHVTHRRKSLLKLFLVSA